MTRRSLAIASSLMLLLASLLLGCAHASAIKPAATSKSPFWFLGWGKPEMVVSEVPEGEQFRISHRGSTGFTSVSAVRRSAKARATTFCEDKGRGMTAITEQTSSHPHILGNFPRAEIVFVCTERLPEVNPPLTAEDRGPAQTSAPPSGGHIGDRLRRLERLHAEGLISDEEYEAKRREILESL